MITLFSRFNTKSVQFLLVFLFFVFFLLLLLLFSFCFFLFLSFFARFFLLLLSFFLDVGGITQLSDVPYDVEPLIVSYLFTRDMLTRLLICLNRSFLLRCIRPYVGNPTKPGGKCRLGKNLL